LKENGDPINEILLLKNIDHKNIVKFYGYSIKSDDGNLVVITELIKNGSLDQNLKKLTLFQKYNILIDISNGLNYLHSREPPIIHRYIKY
jgi:serine/threonine protein kinase